MIVYYSLSGSVSSWRSSSLSSSHWVDWGRGLGLTVSGETQEEEVEDVEGVAGETGTLGVMNASTGYQPIFHHVLSIQGPYHRMIHVEKKSKAVLNHWNTSAWLPNTNLFSGTDSFFFILFFVWLIDLPALGLSCSTWGFCCIMRDLPLQQLNSLVAVCKLSCSTACGILVSQAGIEPISPALQGRFLTTGPPGKSPGTAALASSSLYGTGTKHSSPSSCLLLIPLVWGLLLLFRH